MRMEHTDKPPSLFSIAQQRDESRFAINWVVQVGISIVLVVSCLSCASGKQKGGGSGASSTAASDYNPTSDLATSPFFKEATESDPYQYILRPGDQVEISVYGEDELKEDAKKVDEGGYLSLQLIGKVKVGGSTVREAETMIKNRYEGGFLNVAPVTLNVFEKAKRRFVVLGQVQSPGYYAVPRSIKIALFQAIALAGGYTRIAGSVTIKRTTSDGEYIKRYRLRKLRRLPTSEIPLVLEDDTIIVGESFF